MLFALRSIYRPYKRRILSRRKLACILYNKLHTVYEQHRKGDQRGIVQKEKLRDHYRVWGLLWPEIKKFKQEMIEKFLSDGYYFLDHEDYQYLWKFIDPEIQKSWTVTTDSDLNEGYSNATISRSKSGFMLFNGTLSNKTIDDGICSRTGYCNITSPYNRKSFYRQIPYDWTGFTHIVLRIRGDGRTYQLILGLDRYYDFMWNDQYSYMLFTRGGPYWQTAKIPFSKFYLSHKGRLQDTQESLQRYLHQIRRFGIALADDINGPFQLEIDYIALLRDENHREHFAYELYDASMMEINV